MGNQQRFKDRHADDVFAATPPCAGHCARSQTGAFIRASAKTSEPCPNTPRYSSRNAFVTRSVSRLPDAAARGPRPSSEPVRKPRVRFNPLGRAGDFIPIHPGPVQSGIKSGEVFESWLIAGWAEPCSGFVRTSKSLSSGRGDAEKAAPPVVSNANTNTTHHPQDSRDCAIELHLDRPNSPPKLEKRHQLFRPNTMNFPGKSGPRLLERPQPKPDWAVRCDHKHARRVTLANKVIFIIKEFGQKIQSASRNLSPETP